MQGHVISLTLKNFEEGDDVIETMETTEGLRAFLKPEQTRQRNQYGFGLDNFITLSSIFERGFHHKAKDFITIFADLKMK